MKPHSNHAQVVHSQWAFWRWQRITRADEDPYLIRLILFRCPWFQILLHKFLGSDDFCLHDHPWPFLSLILWGGYWEWSRNAQGHPEYRWYGPGSILLRRANWAHRVQLQPEARDGALHLRPAYSLVITGPKSRSWGFHTPRGWIPWRQYHYATHCAGE